jgi:hypothetical protein
MQLPPLPSRDVLAEYLPFLIKKGAPRFVTASGVRVHGVLAEFDTPAAVYHAAEKVRDGGYKAWDVHSPFPIHGIDEAMGIGRNILPVLVAVGAFSGAGLGYLMQYWMTAVDYRLVVQGKPYGAWEPFTPVTFELGVLAAAFTALLGMLMLNGLPRWNHPLFRKDRFLRSSDDKFFIVVESSDPKFDPRATRDLLTAAGATHVEVVEDPE